ncbi:MAG: hypothetical protein ABIH92_05560 [Nanoarchaeota archaeon]
MEKTIPSINSEDWKEREETLVRERKYFLRLGALFGTMASLTASFCVGACLYIANVAESSKVVRNPVLAEHFDGNRYSIYEDAKGKRMLSPELVFRSNDIDKSDLEIFSNFSPVNEPFMEITRNGFGNIKKARIYLPDDELPRYAPRGR